MAAETLIDNGLCTLNAQSVAEHVARMIVTLVENGLPFTLFPSLMLWGAPGVGKSESVKLAAEMIEKQTGKRVNVTDVRLQIYNPADLHGIPVADAGRQFAIWLRPKIFRMDDSSDIVNVLFLDELTSAPQQVQAAAYQITLDRMVGEHRLPDNCVVIAASNRVTDRSVSFKMPKALANRLCHIEIEADHEAWLQWARRSGIDPIVVGFIDHRPEYLMKFAGVTDELAFPTPRSWETAAKYVKLYGSVDAAMPFIVGSVGTEAAYALKTWADVWHLLPSMNDVFHGRQVSYPTRPDVLYALVSAMLSYAGRRTTTLQEILSSVHFGAKLPPEYGVLLFRGYMKLQNKCDDIKEALIQNRDFSAWLVKNGRFMEG